jgi:hypothetical protein
MIHNICCIRRKVTTALQEKGPDDEAQNKMWVRGRLTYPQSSQLNLQTFFILFPRQLKLWPHIC